MLVSVGVLWRPSTARAAFHGFDGTGCPTTGRIWEILELDTWRRSTVGSVGCESLHGAQLPGMEGVEDVGTGLASFPVFLFVPRIYPYLRTLHVQSRYEAMENAEDDGQQIQVRLRRGGPGVCHDTTGMLIGALAPIY